MINPSNDSLGWINLICCYILILYMKITIKTLCCTRLWTLLWSTQICGHCAGNKTLQAGGRWTQSLGCWWWPPLGSCSQTPPQRRAPHQQEWGAQCWPQPERKHGYKMWHKATHTKEKIFINAEKWLSKAAYSSILVTRSNPLRRASFWVTEPWYSSTRSLS